MNPFDDLIDRMFGAAAAEPAFLVGTVTAVVAGAARDGNAAVTVIVRGSAIPAAYVSDYTPAVGHVVLLSRTQPLVVIGRIIGTPA